MIKRIIITIKPTTVGADWNAFGDFIVDTYDNSSYEYSCLEEGTSDLCHIFYGYGEEDIVQFFREQTGEDSPYPAKLVVKTSVVSKAEWRVLAEKYDLSLPEIHEE